MQIPVLSTLMPLAWAVGADVYVKELDSSFLNSLQSMKKLMRRYYPNFSFASTLYVEKIATNKFLNKGYGLYFSGGIDATTALIKNKNKNPNLIMLFGGDIRLDNREKIRKIKGIYKNFAQEENMNINFITSNFREVINEEYLNIALGKYLFYFWFLDISYAVAVAGLCAPLTVVKSIGTVLMASGISQAYKGPVGEQLLKKKFAWGDIQVVIDAIEFSRQEKISKILKSYIEKTHRYPPIRVCFSPIHDFNCNVCEKCWRTITGLVLENIDPNKCGFQINNQSFAYMKNQLIKFKNRILQNNLNVILWNEIKNAIPDSITHDLYNSRRFFEWFRTFNVSLTNYKKFSNVRWVLGMIYYKLPKNVRILIDKLGAFFKR